nr:immunoglobulin heavy chain junction region [Mus musculus]
CVRWILYGDYW